MSDSSKMEEIPIYFERFGSNRWLNKGGDTKIDPSGDLYEDLHQRIETEQEELLKEWQIDQKIQIGTLFYDVENEERIGFRMRDFESFRHFKTECPNCHQQAEDRYINNMVPPELDCKNRNCSVKVFQAEMKE